MAEVDLGPAQLDRLEDALEDLELDGALDRWLEDEPSPQVRERLTDYHALLAASREAMPIEDVPAGLLDGVIAEAQRAATAAPVTTVAASEGWWTRLRRSFMVPAIALAGTAALVLWIGRPGDQAELADPPPATPASKTPSHTRVELMFDEPDPSATESAKPRRSRAGAASPAAAPPVEAQQATIDGKLEQAEDAIVQPTEIPALDPLGDAPDDEKKDKGAGGVSPGADADAKPAGPASGRWDIVSRGDRARQAGDCIGAREEYAVALEDDEARVRARAFAGIGLCDRRNGDTPAADANFERARELDGGIDGFIDSQTRPKSSTKRAKKKRKKAAPKSKVNSDQVMDPFGG